MISKVLAGKIISYLKKHVDLLQKFVCKNNLVIYIIRIVHFKGH